MCTFDGFYGGFGVFYMVFAVLGCLGLGALCARSRSCCGLGAFVGFRGFGGLQDSGVGLKKHRFF